MQTKRLPYSATIVALAVSAARREIQQRGVKLHTRGNRQWIARTVNNEGVVIAANARSWRA